VKFETSIAYRYPFSRSLARRQHHGSLGPVSYKLLISSDLPGAWICTCNPMLRLPLWPRRKGTRQKELPILYNLSISSSLWSRMTRNYNLPSLPLVSRTARMPTKSGPGPWPLSSMWPLRERAELVTPRLMESLLQRPRFSREKI